MTSLLKSSACIVIHLLSFYDSISIANCSCYFILIPLLDWSAMFIYFRGTHISLLNELPISTTASHTNSNFINTVCAYLPIFIAIPCFISLRICFIIWFIPPNPLSAKKGSLLNGSLKGITIWETVKMMEITYSYPSPQIHSSSNLSSYRNHRRLPLDLP